MQPEPAPKRTAEELFKDQFKTRSAGLFNENPLSEEEMMWADIIVVMEDFQRREIAKRFLKLYLQKQILSLDVPDVFYYRQPQLIEVLNEKMKGLF